MGELNQSRVACTFTGVFSPSAATARPSLIGIGDDWHHRVEPGVVNQRPERLLITLCAWQGSAGGAGFDIVYQCRVDKYSTLVVLPLPLPVSEGQEELLLVDAVLKSAVAVVAIMQNSRLYLPDVPSSIHKLRRV